MFNRIVCIGLELTKGVLGGEKALEGRGNKKVAHTY